MIVFFMTHPVVLEQLLCWSTCMGTLYPCCKWTVYLQKIEAPKVTFAYYSDYSVNILCKYERKIKVRFFFITYLHF